MANKGNSEAIELYHYGKGAYAVVTLTDPALVGDAMYKLRNEKVHDRNIFIGLDSLVESDLEDFPEVSQTRRARRARRTVFTAVPKTVELPLHLYHRSSDAIIRGLDTSHDKLNGPDQQPIVQNRRLYLYGLPPRIDDMTLRDLLKEFSMYRRLPSVYVPNLLTARTEKILRFRTIYAQDSLEATSLL